MAAAKLAEEALDLLDEVDRAASLYKPESDLVRLNGSGFPGPCAVGPLLGDILAVSLRLARATGGAFDPTIKPLMDQLGFYREIGSVEDPRGVPGALARVGWRLVDYKPKVRAARFKRRGMALDLGGVAKGYALDRAASYLAARGVTRAEVELGRSYFFIGRDEGSAGGRFELAVTVPDHDGAEKVRAVVRVPAGSVATSSPWSQTRPGTRGPVGHIVDPRFGPLETRVVSATVWASTGAEADALATALIVSGPGGLRRFARHLRFEALVFSTDGGTQPGAEHQPRVRAEATEGLSWEPVPETGGSSTVRGK